MNAMPAVALPGGSEIRPRQAPRPRRAPGPGRASGVGRAPSLGPAPDARLRLTRRGRVVAAAMAALLMTVLSLLAAGATHATHHSTSPRAARQNLVQVMVRPGQSLWSVAESADPDEDTRAVIQQIVDLNALNGNVVFAGQQLWVPRG